jgi:hypothetical protein
MRELRFLMLSEDGERLVLDGAEGDEMYVLKLDEALRAAIRAEAPRRPAAPETAASTASAEQPAERAIGPREIQVRVRAGESPEHLATAYGLSLDRVMRFAGAVMDERVRIADEARRARARRGIETGESKLVIFGEAVDERFRAHGIDAESVSWDSRRRDDGEWLVVASWLGGESTHAAEWLFSRSSRTVTPLDDTAADLLSDRPIRPVARQPESRPSLSMAPPLVPGIVAFPPMPDATTGPVPVVDDVFDQDAAPEGPRELAPLVSVGAAGADYDEPPLPLGDADPVAATAGSRRNLGVTRREESDEQRAARARVPSWDDILLGIKRRD